MADARAPRRSGRIIVALVVAAVALSVDLASKAWAWDTLRVEGRRKIIAVQARDQIGRERRLTARRRSGDGSQDPHPWPVPRPDRRKTAFRPVVI